MQPCCTRHIFQELLQFLPFVPLLALAFQKWIKEATKPLMTKKTNQKN
jgi:hypothetical protein